MNPGILGYNLFAYCENNPINKSDSTGKWFGLDDTIIGPIDEGIVIGVLGVLSLLGLKWAQNAVRDLSRSLSDVWGSIIPSFAKTTIEDQLTNIAQKHGYGYCDIAAKEMVSKLKKQRKQYKVIKLVCRLGYSSENIWCESKRRLAGTNSYHVGVFYEGKVYCTMHPYGVQEGFWKYDFECQHGYMRAEELGW